MHTQTPHPKCFTSNLKNEAAQKYWTSNQWQKRITARTTQQENTDKGLPQHQFWPSTLSTEPKVWKNRLNTPYIKVDSHQNLQPGTIQTAQPSNWPQHGDVWRVFQLSPSERLTVLTVIHVSTDWSKCFHFPNTVFSPLIFLLFSWTFFLLQQSNKE